MSQWLHYTNFKIDVGQTRTDLYNGLRGLFLSRGWQLHREDAANFTMDWKPPASETIGSALAYEVLRIRLSATTLDIAGYIRAGTLSQKKSYQLRSGITSLSAQNVTFNFGGVAKVFATPAQASNFPDLRTANLYTVMAASADPAVSAYNYTFVPVGDNTGANDYILAVEKVPGSGPAITAGTNGSVTQLDFGVEPGLDLISGVSDTDTLGKWRSISTDYTSGFVVYLEIRSRSFQVATETTASVNGPIFASWIDNADALAMTPPNCIPMELWWGATENLINLSTGNSTLTGNVSSATINLSPTHYTGMSFGNVLPSDSNTARKLLDNQNPSGAIWMDHLPNTASPNSNRILWNYELSMLGLPAGLNGLPLLQGQIDTANVTCRVWNTQAGFGSAAMYAHLKTFIFKDLFVTVKNISNKVLQAWRDQSVNVILTGTITSATASITVSDASGFLAAGAIQIDDEIIEYSGKVGNQLIGCTRGRYATAAAGHAASARVYPILWFVRLNGAVLCAGPTKPTA